MILRSKDKLFNAIDTVRFFELLNSKLLSSFL